MERFVFPIGGQSLKKKPGCLQSQIQADDKKRMKCYSRQKAPSRKTKISQEEFLLRLWGCQLVAENKFEGIPGAGAEMVLDFRSLDFLPFYHRKSESLRAKQNGRAKLA
jgi:hypothetical protein